MPNALAESTSPYLLQHANNPVDWVPWSENILTEAEKQDKLILFSVGYSACHWCHVMERESFEDEEVAQLMNQNFICVKIDREEHPDIDGKLMTAVQLMTQQGGWPLNCICLPNGVPIYGGTYFPKPRWMQVLHSVSTMYKEDREKVLGYGQELQKAVKIVDEEATKKEPHLPVGAMHSSVEKWLSGLDKEWGSRAGAPKFPMPANLNFQLHYANRYDHDVLQAYVDTTLTKMGMGAIFDHVGGGFARYSVDEFWKVPHFEKMLYDNAQLLGVYAKAWRISKNPFYQHIALSIVNYLKEEMLADDGLFFSALDADSESEEGAFYVWQKPDLEDLLSVEEMNLANDCFQLDENGYWENGNYVLMLQSPKVIEQEGFQDLLDKLKADRQHREKPGLDNKKLASWNALLVENLFLVGQVFENTEMIQLAQNALHQLSQRANSESGLMHSLSENATPIQGLLEDYAFLISTFIQGYQTTFNPEYLAQAKALTEQVSVRFSDDKQLFFNFSEKAALAALGNRIEIQDNVIPATNSVMAHNLWQLAKYFQISEWADRATQMMASVFSEVENAPGAYANWADLYLKITAPYYEVVIVGEQANQFAKEIASQGIAYCQLAVAESEKDLELPIFEHKPFTGTTTIYVCKQGACEAPVHTVKEALLQMRG